MVVSAVLCVVICVLCFDFGGQHIFLSTTRCPTNTTHSFVCVCPSGGCVWWEPLATSNTSTLWQSLHPEFDGTTLPLVFNAATFGKNLATGAYSLRSSTSCSACSENKVVSIQGGKELWPIIQVGLFDLYECCFLLCICVVHNDCGCHLEEFALLTTRFCFFLTRSTGTAIAFKARQPFNFKSPRHSSRWLARPH